MWQYLLYLSALLESLRARSRAYWQSQGGCASLSNTHPPIRLANGASMASQILQDKALLQFTAIGTRFGLSAIYLRPCRRGSALLDQAWMSSLDTTGPHSIRAILDSLLTIPPALSRRTFDRRCTTLSVVRQVEVAHHYCRCSLA